jgi:hypothetical protein
MIQVTGNLWTYPADIRIITTNGTVKRDGTAVMGRGCALEAARLHPDLPLVLGTHLQLVGNVPLLLAKRQLMTFPVKHHWMQAADPELIVRSARIVAGLAKPDLTYVMPRPGCGNGRLSWTDIKPLIADILPDNIHVITFGPEQS